MAAAENIAVSGELLQNEPMSRHTSLRVGGPADLYFVPASIEDLQVFLRELDEATPVHWFGTGSNLLVRDGGLRGVVIAAAKVLRDLERVDHYVVRAGAGVPCTQLARQCIRWGIGPSEWFAGIPGTVGGALAMNAGAHGTETWELVESVRTIDRAGEIHARSPGEYTVAYRHVTGPGNEWFIEGTFRFEEGVSGTVETLNAMLERRKSTQPLGLPSCGSVFRNPPGDHAAKLIQSCGLKGFSIGGAEISEKHANFIINRGDATARDVETLIKHIHQTVLDLHGIDLVPEVKIVGEKT
ncbi:MAG TPA: UDP-N-acetylmuramate dehydrogenase [Woeseiaceae bacterium]|nr:UDP-N-acetylmuramate dehydrogenase [Woeseiaceae bacterium]